MKGLLKKWYILKFCPSRFQESLHVILEFSLAIPINQIGVCIKKLLLQQGFMTAMINRFIILPDFIFVLANELILCLYSRGKYMYCGLSTQSIIFYSSGGVTITDEGLQSLTYAHSHYAVRVLYRATLTAT